MRLLVALLVVLLALSPAVAAQSNNSTGGSPPSAECTETIDADTSLCSASLNEQKDQVVVVLQSDRVQLVTLTDAGAFASGGQVPRKRATLQPGRNRVVLGVRSTTGDVGVGIATDDALYSEWVGRSAPLLPGSPDGTDAPTVLIASVLTSIMLILGGAWWFRNGKFGGVRRVF